MTDDAKRAELLGEIEAIGQAMENSSLSSLVRSLLEIDLTIQQLKLLTMLVVSDGMSGQRLAQELGVSMATISGIVDRLETQGLVARVLDERDHRVRLVHATADGREIVLRLSSSREQLGREVLERVPVDDLAALAQGMRAILRAISE
ncbi:MarR family transcriptional regulator [Agromyces protaetiae]|uniref:MarR family transcriptional regulator n=1 Tax=Agromyces protaetiae TaxID=2509455 RepID=A0A4V0YGQ9_9MICO|nr:MarR family transcriptional regulator [Agromyces protaetiae]QAY72071.1 MarR family transcriptional regulator [Agromyces protaetiae]